MIRTRIAHSVSISEVDTQLRGMLERAPQAMRRLVQLAKSGDPEAVQKIADETSASPAVVRRWVQERASDAAFALGGPGKMRSVMRHSAPGATFAAPAGATVRAATLADWQPEPPAPTTPEPLRHLERIVPREALATLVEIGAFGALARRIPPSALEQASDALLPSTRTAPTEAFHDLESTATWLRALDAARTLHHEHPTLSRSRLTEIAGEFEQACIDLEKIKQDLAAVQAQMPNHHTAEHRAQMQELMQQWQVLHSRQSDGLKAMQASPVHRAAVSLIQAVSTAAPDLADRLPHSPPVFLQEEDYTALVGGVEQMLMGHASAQRCLPFLQLARQVASQSPRPPRSYDDMVAHGRTLLPTHMVKDFDALAALGPAPRKERRAVFLNGLVTQDEAVVQELSRTLHTYGNLEDALGFVKSDLATLQDAQDAQAGARQLLQEEDTLQALRAARTRNHLKTACRGHMARIHAAILSSSKLSPQAALELVRGVEVGSAAQERLPADYHEMLATAARIVNGEGFLSLHKVDYTETIPHYMTGFVNVGVRANLEVLLHEAGGHGAEEDNPSLLQESLNFIDQRSTSDVAQSLQSLIDGEKYEENEVALPGRVLHPYILKVYRAKDENGQPTDLATEVSAVGRQYFATPESMMTLAEDPDYFFFLLSGLRPDLSTLDIQGQVHDVSRIA